MESTLKKNIILSFGTGKTLIFAKNSVEKIERAKLNKVKYSLKLIEEAVAFSIHPIYLSIWLRFDGFSRLYLILCYSGPICYFSNAQNSTSLVDFGLHLKLRELRLRIYGLHRSIHNSHGNLVEHTEFAEQAQL